MTIGPPNGRAHQTALLERGDQPGLIYKPQLRRPRPTLFQIVGARDNDNIVPWGFWGGVLAMVVSVLIIGYEGVTGLWAIWDLAGGIALLTAGLLMMRFGARTSLTDEPCAEIDLAEGTLRLTSSTEALALPEVRIADLTEVVYGVTTYPVSSAPGAVHVEAYTLLVRHSSDTLLPVIEASPDKDAMYGLAMFLSRVTRLPLTQVGRGIKG